MLVKILGTNSKLIKPAKHRKNKKQYLITGITMAPGNASGFEVCAWRTDGCTNACVITYVGFNNMPSTKQAQVIKTRLFFEDRPAFLDQLHDELYKFERKARKLDLIPLCRPNVGSDVVYESIDRSIFDDHKGITFYDYTKGIHRVDSIKRPGNYHLTYSYNEKSNTRDVCRLLNNGHNVAMVFDTAYWPPQHIYDPLPKTFRLRDKNYVVVDGDTADPRLPEYDGCGVIVGLRNKGGKNSTIRGVESGFVMRTSRGVYDQYLADDRRVNGRRTVAIALQQYKADRA